MNCKIVSYSDEDRDDVVSWFKLAVGENLVNFVQIDHHD